MAGIVEQQPCQQMLSLVACGGAVGPLGEGLLPYRLEEDAIHDRRLLARKDFVLLFYLADIEVIAQHAVQRTTAERDAAAGDAGGEQPALGPDVALFEVPQQFVDTAKLQISPVDGSDELGFRSAFAPQKNERTPVVVLASRSPRGKPTR